jgi:endonuclease/exonuclease/phosphatase family metal-dependent hydrolase
MTRGTKRWIIWAPTGGVLAVGLYFGLSILIALITDYQPEIKEKLPVVAQKSEKTINASETEFSVLSWNIGYCGLGKEQDFFYDGGKMVKPSYDEYQSYLNQIFNVFDKLNYMDFILMQEIDIDSKRSFYSDQVELFSQALPNMSYSCALNYNVKYIPIPILDPMGKVKGGMATWSRYLPYASDRHGFDVNFSWLKRIFMLDRCFIVTRHKLASGKDLVMINIHNSAFDDENKLKPIELNTLKKFMVEEYQKGNFVVAGGDWNQNPPKFKPDLIDKSWNPGTIVHPISDTLFASDWNWVYDPHLPSNRFTDRAFKKGVTKTTIIDFFLLSPNVRVKSVETLNLEFKYSDHQPLIMTFDIVPEEKDTSLVDEDISE